MEFRICSLSGVAVATLPAGPLETVADLKEKFANSTSLEALCEVKFLMGGTILDEKCRLEELQLGAAAELHVIQSLKSAREILFSSTEVAFELAKQYNALQDQCAERIGSLFLDEQGNPRSHMANIEVLLALQQKLSQPQDDDLELAEFKGALTKVALAALEGIEGPFGMGRQVLRGQFIRCFAWLGLAAVQALLGQISSSQLRNVPEPAVVQSLLIREFAQLPAGSLQRLTSQLSRNDISGTSQLEVIFEKAVAEAAQAAKKKMEAKRTPRTQRGTCRCSVCSRGRVETIQELSPMGDSDEVLRVVRCRPCKFITAGQEVEIDTSFPDAGNRKKALRNAVLTAIEQEPDMILPNVDQALALAAVQKYPGTYRYLPEAFKMDRDILYAALKCDHSLRAEFLGTAGTREIRQWQWHVAGGDRLQKKVCRVR